VPTRDIPDQTSCSAPTPPAGAQVAHRGERTGSRRWQPSVPPNALVVGAPTGRRAAGVVALAFVAMLASSAGQSYWLSLFVDHMIAGTGLSRTGFSLVYGIATLCSALMVVAIGTFFDRRGPALTWLVVACGLAAGGVLMSVAVGAAVAIVGLALLRAFGQGSFPLLGTLLVTGTFDAWRGRALSVATMGVTLAAAALPPIAAALIAAYGWRTALQLTAAVVLCLIAPLALAVRRVVGRQARRPARRSETGYGPRGRLAAAAAQTGRFPWRDGGARLLLTIAAAPLVSTAAVFHATSLLSRSGLDAGAAAAALSVTAFAGAGGALTGGGLVDRAGVRASVVGMNIVLAGGVVLLLVPRPMGAYAGFALVGIASGLNGTAGGAAWAHTYGVERLGELQGVGHGGRIAGAALGPLPLALALGLSGSYAPGLVALGALAVGCALLGLGIPGRERLEPAPAGA
jgi:MFS family permease